VSAPIDELVAEGQQALERGDGSAARRAFEVAAAEIESGAILQSLAEAAYLELDFGACISFYERAYAAFRDEGDVTAAFHAARLLTFLYGAIVGDGAVMSGWDARAETLSTQDGPEAGWVLLGRARFESDRPVRNQRLRDAVAIARQFGDAALELLSLAYLGASLVHGDETDEGMKFLDEALAGVTGGEVKDVQILQDVFCQLFSACEYAHDITRADQWIRIGDEIARGRNLPAVSAFCRTHYGGLLTVAGRWVEADAALTEAARIWALGFGPLRGGALIRLGDLRARQGRFEEAEQLLAGFDTYTEAARPLAAMHLARGDTMRAVDTIERALAQMDAQSAGAAPLWALLVDVQLARGGLGDAATALERLDEIARRNPSHYLQATAALARGKLCLAGSTGDPTACLRDALSGFAKAQVPMELAATRLELARALRTDRPEVALAEAKTALDSFEHLEAPRQADIAAALLRELGAPVRSSAKSTGLLTKRETEVLDLLGHGLSNPEISDRLFISRKTVEHHVGRVLAKLGLRSRAEAAAYATRSERSAPK
jgi:DNA-binding NarL/FixJ family response regulator